MLNIYSGEKLHEKNFEQVNEASRDPWDWLSIMLANIGDAVITADAEGRVTFLNPVAQSLTGWTHAEAVGNPLDVIFTTINQDTRENVESPTIRALRDGVVIGLANHILLIAKDGAEHPIDDTAAPIRNERNEVTGVMLIFRDITEPGKTESELQNSEIRYRRLFETAKDGILILETRSAKITDANPFMTEMLGYSHNHFLGQQLWEIGLESDRSAIQAAVRELQEKGYIRFEHLPFQSNTGQRVEVEIIANIYREDCQSVIQCNVRNITERTRLEKQMQAQTVALADLHRRKDEFLAMLSHELRNPLAPITSAVHLLRLQQNENPIQLKALTIIDRQVGQLARLIDDLLEVSRITTGRIHLQQETLDLAVVVGNAVETVRVLIDQRRHTLEISLPPEPLWVDADAARMEQVVVNLLTNAAKYSDDGGQISLDLRQEADEAVLRVRDQGIGIAPELLPCIFDLFIQAERSLDRAQGGLGIGLCLVQRLVEMHQGRVEVSSVLGEGSVFTVHLPAIVASTTSSSTIPEDTEPREGALRVMVVDDNVDAAETLEMLLEMDGHDVRLFHDGPATLKAALDFHPDIVLLDIGLPGMDGFEVARRLRELPVFEDVTLVALTGYGQMSDRLRSLEAGFDHHLVKPTSIQKLKQILTSRRPRPR